MRSVCKIWCRTCVSNRAQVQGDQWPIKSWDHPLTGTFYGIIMFYWQSSSAFGHVTTFYKVKMANDWCFVDKNNIITVRLKGQQLILGRGKSNNVSRIAHFKSPLKWFVTVKFQGFFCRPTAQGEKGWELSAVMNPRRICRTRHPQVFVDGGGGDDIPVDGGRPPVTVRQAHPKHHPTNEPQNQSHYFHNRIHDPTAAQQSRKSKSRSWAFLQKSIKFIKNWFGCDRTESIWECGVSSPSLWDVSSSNRYV